MLLRILRSRLFIAVAAATIGLGVAGGVVAAQTTSSSTVYFACVNNSSGTIHVVSSTGQCSNNEVSINWNQQGPAGPQGLTGPQGPAGPSGGFGNFWAAATFTLTSDGCPAGQYMIAIAQQWGNALSLADQTCAAPVDVPGYGYGVTSIFGPTASATLHTSSPDASGLFLRETSGEYSANAIAGDLKDPQPMKISVGGDLTTKLALSVGQAGAGSATLADYAQLVAAGMFVSAPVIINQLPN
jgi:hypothetical protein